MASVFLNVASTHFRGTLAGRHQPHTILLHLEFVRRTRAGPGMIKVRHMKLGRQTSTVSLSLWQDDREKVVGYSTNLDMHAESGLTLPTGYSLAPPPPAVDMSRLRDDTDINWKLQSASSFPTFRTAYKMLKMFLPRERRGPSNFVEEWLTFADGGRFTNESLGFVADWWPSVVENYRPKRLDGVEPAPNSTEGQSLQAQMNEWPVLWYPTLVFNLDIKKILPNEGVEWLYARVSTKSVKNGRLDLEVVIKDETGDIVALSHHACLILPMSRNMAGRHVADSESKI